MSKTTKTIMRRFKNKLTRLVYMHMVACGHEAEVQKAVSYRFDLEDELEAEIERLVVKAGEP